MPAPHLRAVASGAYPLTPLSSLITTARACSHSVSFFPYSKDGFAPLPLPGSGSPRRTGPLPQQESARSQARGCSACTSPSGAVLPLCKASQETAGGFSGVKASALRCAPAGGVWARAGVTPRRWTRSHRGVPASWWSAAQSRHHREGVRSCPSVDVGRRHCACRAGTLAPGASGRVERTLWWLGAPRPLPGRSGVWFDWSLTTGLCAADRDAVEGFPWPGRHRGRAGSGAAPLACVCSLRVFRLERRRKVMLWSLLRQGPRGARPGAAGSPP
jgi:hypothetical protein